MNLRESTALVTGGNGGIVWSEQFVASGVVALLVGGILALLVSFVAFRLLLRESLGSLLLLTGIDAIHFLPPGWQVLLVIAGALVLALVSGVKRLRGAP